LAVDAEHYYRIMVRSDRESWNVRDHHMVDSVEWLARHMGEGSKGLVSAHNTRVGDAWATDTARAGLVNVGQLPRERVGDQGVLLIGFASHRGSVLTAPAWGEPEHALDVPVVRVGSHEVLLHTALGAPAVPEFDGESTGPWSSRGHRAIGVVNDPGHEAGTYVPIRIGGR
jgi:erythromycin esterase-like protein